MREDIEKITVIPVSVMRTVFPGDVVMQQPYIRDGDWILLRPAAGVKDALRGLAGLRDESARLSDGSLRSPPLYPDIVSGFFPGSISYLRIADDAHQKIRDVGIKVTVITDPEEAKKIALPPSPLATVTER